MNECWCYQTRADAESTIPTIPVGTPVMIEQFDSDSAVSHALYVFYGSSNPGHPLSFENGSSWWVIDPDYVTLEAAGAPPPGNGDCAPAMANVLLYYQQVGLVELKLLERDYILNDISIVTAQNAPARGSFSITGKGPALSRLIVPYPTNTRGAFSVQFNDSYSHYALRNFSVLASGATGQTSGCGTAIAMNFVRNLSPDDGHCGTLEHVRVGPLFDSNGNGWSYFLSGVDLSGTPMPFLFDVKVAGCQGLIAKGNYADTSPRYFAQTLLTIDNCYDPRIMASIFWHATTAISYVCDFAQVQSFTSADVEIEGVQTGLYTRHVSECPDGQIHNTFCQFRNIGFDLGNIRRWRLLDNTMRIEGSETTVYDMRFIAATTVVIALHNFEAGDLGSTTDGRINIFVDAETPSNGVNHGENFLIETNVFGERPVNPFATSAIVATQSAQNIQIGATNAYNGQFGGPVVNDESGTAVALLGYPGVPSTPPVPAVVAPSGNSTIGPTNLGSDAAPWPANYSQTHYVTSTNSAPKTPGSGWVIYADTAGTLWAWNGTDKKQLAP
ncbi:MAG: hypothetical protein ACREHF_07700 [Rhizomicrobium sp.]